MASSTYHTIAVQYNELTRLEALAHEAITPGELLLINSDEELTPHSADAGVLPGKLICLESITPDTSTTASIDLDYAANDTAYYAQAKAGEVYYMWLKASETVVKGVTQLVSDGAGALKGATVDATTFENSVVGIAEQDLTAGIARTRCLVRIV
jgi:hypothetical protein